MGFVGDVILSIPFGIIYYFFIDKLMNVVLCDLPYAERYQKSLIFIFVIGLIGLILAFTLFKNNPFFKNRALRFGLILGSALLIFYSIISNWNKMDDTTKIIIFSIMLGLLVCYYYYNTEEEEGFKKIKKKEEKNNNIYKHKNIE